MLGARISGDEIANIFGKSGLNIYYDPLLDGNDYLDGLAYFLQDGGLLAPVIDLQTSAPGAPLPGSFYLVVSCLAGMAVLGRRGFTSRN